MKDIEVAAISTALCLAFACPTFGQVHDRYENVCPSLQDAVPPDLLQYLNGVNPDEKNAWCVTWAIHKLSTKHYEPAITALVKLLDFQRPQTPQEKIGFADLSSTRLFPAQDALEEIGKPSLPEVLRAIEVDSTSPTARQNAVEVWMEVYRRSGDQLKGAPQTEGIALLKQAEMKTADAGTKQRLAWAVQKALTHCNPHEEAACRQAAVTGVP